MNRFFILCISILKGTPESPTVFSCPKFNIQTHSSNIDYCVDVIGAVIEDTGIFNTLAPTADRLFHMIYK